MYSIWVRSLAALTVASAAILCPPVVAGAPQAPAPPLPVQQSSAAAAPLTDVDAFMARVLERRDESWRKLHDYVLSEQERFGLYGPGGIPLHGMRRDYSWFVKEGFLVRSPIRFDGVALNEEERRRYEGDWLDQERRRETRAKERGKAKSSPGLVPGESRPADPRHNAGAAGATAGDASLQDFVDQRGEPRFISEAYFMRFRFEPGNYYVVGREKLDGREVVRIEYYPKRMFSDDREKREDEKARYEVKVGSSGVSAGKVKEDEGDAKQEKRSERKPRSKDKADPYSEDEMARKFNKVAMVTLWVDPAEYQIVKYTFDNMDFGFLPGRWLVRVDEARASMTMGRVLDGVWLPSEITMNAGLSLALGPVTFEYGRKFSDYKKAETSARIRSFDMREE